MPYTPRPFQPDVEYDNQVETELNLANDNFEILSQAFVSNDPTTLIVKNADKLNNYPASLVPSPYTIPVAGEDGKLDSGWISGGGGGGIIDLTNATEDYELQVGETAYIGFSDTNSKPLRIAIPNDTTLYEIYVISFTEGSTSLIRLLPNNTTYTSEFSYVILIQSQSGTSYEATTRNDFMLSKNAAVIKSIINVRTKTISSIGAGRRTNSDYTTLSMACWIGDAQTWTSLGTIMFNTNGSGYVLVRRLY